MKHCTISINRSGWLQAARDMGITSVAGFAQPLGMDAEACELMWAHRKAPTVGFIAKSLKAIPAPFGQLYLIR